MVTHIPTKFKLTVERHTPGTLVGLAIKGLQERVPVASTLNTVASSTRTVEMILKLIKNQLEYNAHPAGAVQACGLCRS